MSESFLIQANIDDAALERLMDAIAGSNGKRSAAAQFGVSINSVLKRTRDSARTASWKEVKEEYAITRTEFYKYTRVTRNNISSSTFGADATDMALEITYAGHKIPLSKFDVQSGSSQRGKGVKQAVAKRLKNDTQRTTWKNAFYATANNHFGVFEREGDGRLPIEEKMGLAGAQMVGNEDVMDKLTDKAIETFDKRLEYEIDRIINGWNI